MENNPRKFIFQVIRGETECTPESDAWSFGILLWETFTESTKKIPFSHYTNQQLREKLAETNATLLSKFIATELYLDPVLSSSARKLETEEQKQELSGFEIISHLNAACLDVVPALRPPWKSIYSALSTAFKLLPSPSVSKQQLIQMEGAEPRYQNLVVVENKNAVYIHTDSTLNHVENYMTKF